MSTAHSDHIRTNGRDIPEQEQGLTTPDAQHEPHAHDHAGEAHTGVHRHVLEDGTVIEHSHAHGHTHTHQNTKAVVNRLARAIGHLEKVKNMVEAGEDCSEVLVQLSAVRSALSNTGKLILKDHMEHCLVDAVQSGDLKEIEDLTKAIDQFIK